MTPHATVVVTAFDREASLSRLLTGLNNQSAQADAYEVVLADDSGHTKLGERVLNKLKTAYRISLVRTGLPHEVNGVSVARNRGIEHSRGRIIISIDDDCFPSFFFIEEHIAAHQRPYPVIVLGHRTGDASKLKENRPISITEPKAVNELVAGGAGLLCFHNFMTGNISLSKQVALDAGLFDENFAQPGEHGYEDIELGYRLWRKGIPMIFSRNAMIYRPPTEREKEQRRTATLALEKASNRLLGRHPLLPKVKQFLDAIHSGQSDRAIGFGHEIIAKDPQHWPVLVHMGDLLSRRGEIEAAQQHLNCALDLYAQNPDIYLKLAQLMFRQKRLEAALEHTLKTLALNPNQTRALYLLAQLKTRLSGESNLDRNAIPDIHLELGGGVNPTKYRDEGRDDYINMDAINCPTVDVIADFTQRLPIPDGSVSRIFSREMIEHLPYRKFDEFLAACHRVLRPGGEMYLCCPDFEAIMNLYPRKCDCFVDQHADPACPKCKGSALISDHYWRSNLLGDQNDYGDGGINDTHKNQFTYPMLAGRLKAAGFVNIQRDTENPNYEPEKRSIKLSVKCIKSEA